MGEVASACIVRYDRGTLLLEGVVADLPTGFVQDPRVQMPRGPASRYHDLILDWRERGLPYRDEARAYGALGRKHRLDRVPREYQTAAVDAWRRAGRRGTVVLPTGAGKSLVAEMCISDADRSALVVAPTIDLVGQWYDQLKRAFDGPIGVLGGGSHEVEALTVATYDSAWMYMDRYGDRFGLLIFDEVHHLPGPSYSLIAELSLAPFRLGLTATLERPDGEHQRVFEQVGPVVYRLEITDLAGDFLADYRTECIEVHLSVEDRASYQRARSAFRAFVDEQGIALGSPDGWQQFLRVSARSREGRAAFRAWQESRRLLEGAPAKLRMLEELLRRHREGRVLVFTNDNATVYEISRRFLVPAITHQTEVKERRAYLEAFAAGRINVLATSRVLNEGIDLPSADVAIVLSGSQTVREHVQRLGRILRKQAGKQATLYELVVADSAEQGASQRRRDHVAWRGRR